MKINLLHFITTALVAMMCCLATSALGQGVTTASIHGTVMSQDGTPLEGATVVAIHQPTSTKYGVLTREGGKYNLPNVRVGGPYTITSSYVGYGEGKIEGLYLNLGQNQKVNFSMAEEGMTTDEVVISAELTALGGDKTGAETVIGEAQIQRLPTVSRDLTDFLRSTPQATLTEDGDGEQGFSVAGQNNRFNSVFIDGAISNDVFGLTDQGTNGGQAGISPISVDAIEQFNIVVAPYDVTIGGFSGAGVNAVTRSGSNTTQASVYGLYRNQGLAGKTPTDDPDEERLKLADFNSSIAGFRVGGAIKKDKIFFFVNAEIERRNTPQPFNFNNFDDDYLGDASQQDIDALITKLNGYGYDPGTYLDNPRTVDAEKFLAKLDFNLSDRHNLTLRHSYSKGRAEKTNASVNDEINFSNTYEFFPSTTNSTALELNSVLGAKTANKLIVGYTTVVDDRDPLGDPFPRITINDNLGTITVGSEEFSTANKLDQNIFTITDNFNIYAGNHNITIGTHNEFYSVFNLFVRQNYGSYTYDSLSQFMMDMRPSQFARSYALTPEGTVENAVGDDITQGAAEFNAMQLGFYLQDEWQVTPDFSLTGGLRVDIPIFSDNPGVDTYFNDSTIDKIQVYHDLQGARAGQMPSPQIMLAPRLGFNYDVYGQGKTKLRGGLGLFTSRLPLVWAGGSFANNGLKVGGVFVRDPDITFEPDVTKQPTATDFGQTNDIPSGQMDLFAEDLKFPRVFRASLAIDQKLPWKMIGTIEGIFTKTLNSVFYKNVNLKPHIDRLDGADNRLYFDDRDVIDGTYSRILLGLNTNKGYAANFTASLTKPFDNGLTFGVAYNFGYSESLNDLTSSQNSSQWRNMEVAGSKNDLPVTRSDFSAGHRVVANAAYRIKFGDNAGATLSLFYNGQSGEVFSYVYAGGRADALSNQDSRDYTDLIYVPARQDEINFVGTEAEQQQQWEDFNAFIEQDNYLSTRRGKYAERNGARTPALHIVDMRFLVDFSVNEHKFQLSLDIFNFTNLLNKDWGRRYRSSFNGIQLITFEGFEDRGEGPLTPTFSFDKSSVTNAAGEIESKARLAIDDAGLLSSRWQGQIGIRYLFN